MLALACRLSAPQAASQRPAQIRRVSHPHRCWSVARTAPLDLVSSCAALHYSVLVFTPLFAWVTILSSLLSWLSKPTALCLSFPLPHPWLASLSLRLDCFASCFHYSASVCVSLPVSFLFLHPNLRHCYFNLWRIIVTKTKAT